MPFSLVSSLQPINGDSRDDENGGPPFFLPGRYEQFFDYRTHCTTCGTTSHRVRRHSFFFFENVRFRYLLRFAVRSIRVKNMPARYISSFSSSANTDAVMVAARRFSTSGWSDMCNAVVVSFAVVVRTPYRNLCAPYTHVRCRADI